MTALVAAAMLADLATFALVVPIVGIGAEQNPVMAQGYSLGGIAIVAALKLAALAAIVLLVARVRRPRLRVLAASIAIVVGVTGAASNVTAWASRPAPESAPAVLPGSTTTEGSVTLPSRDALARTGDPGLVRVVIAAPSPSAAPVAVLGRDPQPETAHMPAAAVPAAAGTISGIATWFRSPQGVSAAGPSLRAALPGWRGAHVRVCHDERCVVTVLGDTMAADRLVDLDAPLFARLAPLSAGVLAVTLTVIPAPPVTAAKETP